MQEGLASRKRRREESSMTEIPNHYRDKLVPTSAVGTPKPIAEASERLRLAGLDVAETFRCRRAKQEAARNAPLLDQQAAIAARQRGEDATPTAPALKAEVETALQSEQAAKAIADDAERGLERTIREHGDKWLPKQREDAQASAQAALEAVDALAGALDRLSESAGIVAALQTPPIGKAIEHSRSFKRRPVGLTVKGRQHFAAQLLAELREGIAATVPAEPEPPSAEDQDFKERQRRMHQLAHRGGVFVGGGQ
jgi:hypothetical protein